MLKILVPQLLLAVLVAVLKIAQIIMKGKDLAEYNWFNGLGYWFLPALFFCSVLYIMITCVVDMKDRRKQIIVFVATALAICCTLYIFDIPNGFFMKYLKIVPIAFLFYLLGSMFREQSLEVAVKSNRLTEATLLVAAPLLFIVSQWNTPIRMYKSDYGFMPFFLVTSFLGIFLVVEVMKRIKTLQILVEIGQLSIAIYVWNFLVVGFVKAILLRVLHIAGLYTSGAHAALTFVISMMLLFFVSKLTLRYLPWLYGKKR